MRGERITLWLDDDRMTCDHCTVVLTSLAFIEMNSAGVLRIRGLHREIRGRTIVGGWTRSGQARFRSAGPKWGRKKHLFPDDCGP